MAALSCNDDPGLADPADVATINGDGGGLDVSFDVSGSDAALNQDASQPGDSGSGERQDTDLAGMDVIDGIDVLDASPDANIADGADSSAVDSGLDAQSDTGGGREFQCGDGRDNDGDFLVDCDDSDCEFIPPCLGGEGGFEFQCGDGIDNDGDLLVDCDDDNCTFIPPCTSSGIGFEWECSDSIDNDGDSQVDCDDSDCQFFPVCR